MGKEHAVFVLWRRKWVLLATFVVFTAVAGVVSKALPKEYEATATLWINQGRDVTSFDAVQAGAVLARTYGNVVGSENVASQVAAALPFQATGSEVQSHMSFEPVTEAQLLTITATDRDPVRAREYANTYADVFIVYARQNLSKESQSTVTLADRATLPTTAARPKPTLYTLLGALVGLVIGTALAFLAQLLDRRVHSAEELSELLGVPIMARVPRRTRAKQTHAAYAEAYRMLRTNLEFARPDQPLRSVTVMSPSDGEGKTSTALNLAKAVAEAGRRVILVEGDMRRPGLQQSLFAEPTPPLRPGLSNFLVGSVSVEEAVHSTDETNIEFVPSGPIPPNPSTLLSARRGRNLLDDLAKRCDLVIVDTPPLSIGADASLLAASSDGGLVVVDLDRSSKSAVRRAQEQLRVVKAQLIGAIVNRVRRADDYSPYLYYSSDGAAANGHGRLDEERLGGADVAAH